MEPENMSIMSSCPLYTLCMKGENEAALYWQWFVI